MTSVLLHTLNHYPEFQSNAGINGIIAYVNSLPLAPGARVFPAHINTNAQRARYHQKFGNNFVVVGAIQLFYRPSPRINLEVVRPQNHFAVLNAIWNNPRQGLGVGVNAFYYQVCSRYLAITRVETTQFLQSKGDYQIGRNFRKMDNKKILAKCSQERWGIDCIDMTAYPNANYRYILTVVDYFSKYVFARAMTRPSAVQVRNHFANICLANGPSYPHILQSDNGNEFQGALTVWINAHNAAAPPNQQIHHIYTTTYNPQSNGQVERANQEIRKKIRAGFVRNNNRLWRLQLPDYIANINSQRPLRTKYTPNELWTPGYNPPPPGLVNFHIVPTDQSTLPQIQDVVKARSIRTAIAQLNQGDQPQIFHIGDWVRVKYTKINAQMRRRHKEGILNKRNAIRYSLDVYRVSHIYPAPIVLNGLHLNQQWSIARQSYNLTLNGVVVMTGATPTRFFASDMIHVFSPGISLPPSIVPPNEARMLYINRF